MSLATAAFRQSEARLQVSAREGVHLKSSGFGVQCAAFSEPFLARLFLLPGRLLALCPSRSPHPHPSSPPGLVASESFPTGPLQLRGHTERPPASTPQLLRVLPRRPWRAANPPEARFLIPQIPSEDKVYPPWGPSRGRHCISQAAEAWGLLAFPLLASPQNPPVGARQVEKLRNSEE